MTQLYKLTAFVLLTLSVLVPIFFIQDTNGAPVPGKKAFGLGMLGGALGGMAMGSAITNMHHSHQNQNVPLASHSHEIVVRRGEIMHNGCYKQIVKQPDPHDSRRFIETEQLICPNTAPITAPIQTAPLYPVVPMQEMPTHVLHPIHPTAHNPVPAATAGTSGQYLLPVPIQLPQNATALQEQISSLQKQIEEQQKIQQQHNAQHEAMQHHHQDHQHHSHTLHQPHQTNQTNQTQEHVQQTNPTDVSTDQAQNQLQQLLLMQQHLQKIQQQMGQHGHEQHPTQQQPQQQVPHQSYQQVPQLQQPSLQPPHLQHQAQNILQQHPGFVGVPAAPFAHLTTPTPAPGHVVVLSTKRGTYGKSAAADLMKISNILMLSVFCFVSMMIF